MSDQNEWFCYDEAVITAEKFNMHIDNVNHMWCNTYRILTELDLVPATTLAATFGNTPNDAGATLIDNELQLQPADATHPGGVTASGTQTFGGNKIVSGTLSASNLSGTNTGDITLTTIGNTPNANGLSLTGQQLRAQPANGSFGGVVTTAAQPFAGEKTFNDGVVSLKRYRMPNTVDSTTGVLEWSTTGEAKRLKIHNYSAFPNYSNNIYIGGGDGTPETQAGNFSHTGVNNIGMGDGVLYNVTSGTGNTIFNSGTLLTSGSSNILFWGGQNITTANSMMVFGENAYDSGTGEGPGTHEHCIIMGTGAAEDVADNLNCKNSVILGPYAAATAENIENSVFISGREIDTPSSAVTDLTDSTILNCDVSGTDRLNSTVGLQSTLTELATLSGSRQKTYINYPSNDFGGGGSNSPVTKIGGVYTGGYDGNPTDTITEVKMVVADNTERVTSLPLPGAFGTFYQTVSNFSFANKSTGNVVPFSGSITTNPFLHTVGNTFVIDISGLFLFQFRFQCSTTEANLIWFVRKNGANRVSQSFYLGPGIVGLENPPGFLFIDKWDAGDVVDFTIQGNSDPGGGGNIAAAGAHTIGVHFFRCMSDYPYLQ
jgi:hypothetical protein